MYYLKLPSWLYAIMLSTASILSLTYSAASHSAYCSLRDPTNAIKAIYPEATHHRSITREVNHSSRNKVSERLPFTLLLNELGRHTLYVVMKDKMPLGFIHARSELSEFGLVEIVWALNPDLTIKDSYFQRCRNKECKNINFMADIKAMTNTRSFTQLYELMGKENINKESMLAINSATLKQAVLKSALKTIAVTETVWFREVNETRRNVIAYNQFGTDKNLTITPTDSSAQHDKLRNNISFNMINPHSVQSYDVGDNNGSLGSIVYSQWKRNGFSGAFRWLFTPDGTILNIYPTQPWPNYTIAEDFESTLGKNISNESLCGTATELAGENLFRLSRIY